EERRPRIAEQRARLVAGDERDHPADEYRYRRVDQRDDKAGDEECRDQTARLSRIVPIERGQTRGRRPLRRQSGRFEQAFEKPEEAHGKDSLREAGFKWRGGAATQP